MPDISAGHVRGFLLDHFSERLSAAGFAAQEVPDDFDLLTKGIIDSFGIMELISAVEERFSVAIDFERLPLEDLTVIGPFARYVSEHLTIGVRDEQGK